MSLAHAQMQMPRLPSATQMTPKVAKKSSWKAQSAARNAAVFQIVWTAYSSGRKFLVVFQMVRQCALP